MKRRSFLRRSAASALGLPLLGAAAGSAEIIPNFDSLAELSGEDYWKGIRKLFPLPKDEVYFNTGTLGVMPTEVLDKVVESLQTNAYEAAQTNYQGGGPLLLSGYEAFVALRKKIGLIINADYKSIALIQNATAGMNYISNGLDLQAGDEIINTDQEHGGGRAGWETAARRYGLVYKQAKFPIPANDPQEIIDNIFAQVTPKTKVIAIPHMISVYGVVLPVKEICAEAKKRGIFTILDGAQCVGQLKVDVQDIGCDAYFSSLHKWMLAPAGNGILYINPESIERIWTVMASYQWENEEDHGFRLTQRGTGNISLIIGMEAAIDFHNRIGNQKVIDRVKELGDYLRSGLQEIPKVSIVSSIHPDMCAGITTYQVAGITPTELQNELWKRKKLQPRAAGEAGLRHSTHIYNLKSEIDLALDIIADVAKRS